MSSAKQRCNISSFSKILQELKRPWVHSSTVSFLVPQALPQRCNLHKLQQLHAFHHSFNTSGNIYTFQPRTIVYAREIKTMFLCVKAKGLSTYQNVNFGEESSLRISSKSKIDLGKRQKDLVFRLLAYAANIKNPIILRINQSGYK